MKKEAHVNFLIDSLDGRSTHMPADVMVYEWVREKHAFVNLTKVSPLVGLMVMVFSVEQAVLKVMSSRVVKRKKSCSNNQYTFIPFALTLLVF